ncbi:TetR/AcrR family transcriptional regulator [Lentilactobacillus hilgardii]|jgi:AcrR family transcriptional regulator|uniref:Transcriptional regulator, TetR family n=1 Tax=Lentilactobacillus hilgardii (strain ATCC 8290 / DSM 20176 / CCUG 30140 / JCM 1155 / KCTC 3500 / NBRC 15886 / NCIMB 8040 / NRRL B-1843 / 9) TaxID=1423757 RepID=C0XJ82_LENH9|nr:TetR/AcrR family transcriptional regulator [Lentilactobacillus hilgardii]MCI2018160.1 TetR/AcrR family transcriptional regulator [Lentilactobacillus buchneri]EEI24556.1 transcriptional regulator, TetR family [Lentilactobacillus hilgardii DSM 20176 = ATCC 8290]KRK57272.1 transcriptional regulator [Lentilactobacillus hilgardii DSM 20176 = ATCC 8290]QEU37662.1 TetR/AcrR family transcriptional regulator [Lentilactobacillus hilgardii]TDG80691.1 hypothetical protein C5L34_000892 [Lentilactobacill
MVSTTFLNLNNEKKTRIQKALIDEFSSKPLAEAEVAPIVKQAGIARGAFYKYFDDLRDAYQYIYGLAMKSIHGRIDREVADNRFEPDFYVNQVTSFVDGVCQSDYRDLVKMHLRRNESLIDDQFDDVHLQGRQWAAMVLSHQVIKQILLNPKEKDVLVKRLQDVLTQLARERS